MLRFAISRVLHASALICVFVATAMGSVAQAYNVRPVDGLWGFDSETDFPIGRAFNLEMSNNLLVVTFFNYNSAGAPTFYVAAGALNSDDSMSTTMHEPAGGTCLGCTPRGGMLLASHGTIKLEFTSSTSGYVTLPGETRKSISKGRIAWPADASALIGVWTFNYIAPSGTTAEVDVVFLTTLAVNPATGNSMAYDPVKRIGCERQAGASAIGDIACVQVTTTGVRQRLVQARAWGHRMDGGWASGADNTTMTADTFTASRLLSASGRETLKRATGVDAKATEAMLLATLADIAVAFPANKR